MPPVDRVQLSPEVLVEAIGDDWPSEQVDAVLELLATSRGRFPSGSRKLPVELVRVVQRERLIAAMLDAAATCGYRETNVQDVIERAGVSRPTFYEHFENKEACFLAAFDAAASRLRQRIDTAAGNGESWRERLRLGLEEVLRFVAEDPDAAMSLIVDGRAACPEALTRRDDLLDHFASCLDSMVRAEADPANAPSAIGASRRYRTAIGAAVTTGSPTCRARRSSGARRGGRWSS